MAEHKNIDVISVCINATMTDSVRQERAVFLAIANGPTSTEDRRQFLAPLSRAQVKALAEVAANVLYGTIGLSRPKKKTLLPLKPFLRSLANEEIGSARRKKIIVTHPTETFLLVRTVYKNLEDLIWRNND